MDVQDDPRPFTPPVQLLEIEAAPPLPRSAGYRTTEFWLSAVVVIAATVLLAIDKIDPEAWMAVATGSAVGYPIGRGLAKLGNK